MRRRRRSWGHCCWCQRQLTSPQSNSETSYTRDHVVPQSLGGTRTVPACFTCNQLKGDMLMAEWRAFMAAYPQWWLRWPRRNRHAA